MSRRTTLVFVIIALSALTLSAITGVLLRFGLIQGMPAWAQNYGAVRHAHSHLMYFGWVTLALMALIWADLPRWTGRPVPRLAVWQMALTAALALLSYPAFWPNGYGLTQIGGARLPLGAMVSAWNGLTWFFFIGLYLHATWRMGRRPAPVALWDWALVLLVVASGGAVGLMGMVFSHAENPTLRDFFLHQFLDLFAVGWFNLALLGVVWSWLAQRTPLPRWLPTMSLALLLAPTFVLGMAPLGVTAGMFNLGMLANLGAAVLLSVHLAHLWRRRTWFPMLAWLAFAALGVTIVTAVALVWPGFWEWAARGQLRIFYLHDLLLAWISTMLVIVLELRYLEPAPGFRRTVHVLWGAGVGAMLVALLGLGFAGLLPVRAVSWLWLAAWASVPVAAAAALLLFSAVAAWRRGAESTVLRSYAAE